MDDPVAVTPEAYIDKTLLLAAIIERLQADLDNAVRAAQVAHEAATHEEAKAENKYDTRGLEASYLAAGQSRRVEEIRRAVGLYRALPVQPFDEQRGVRVGDLVELESANGTCQWFFIGPDGAGLAVRIGGQAVTVITPHAPLGQQLLGKLDGDSVDLRVNGKPQHYEVVAVH